MPTFEELAKHTSYPVLHSKRNDGEIVIATRIPFTNSPWQQWGWILTLGSQGKQPSDSFECLFDNAGRQYPKVYLHADIMNYIETWRCYEWEAGYQPNEKTHIGRVTMPLGAKPIEEEAFIKTIEGLQQWHEQKIKNLQDIVLRHDELFKVKIDMIGNNLDGIDNKIQKDVISVYSNVQKAFDALSNDVINNINLIRNGDVVLPLSIQQKIGEWREELNNKYQEIEREQEDAIHGFAKINKKLDVLCEDIDIQKQMQ